MGALVSVRRIAPWLFVALLSGCTAMVPPRPLPPSGPRPVADPARVHALLINGGGRRSINYLSHVVHLRSLLRVLDDAGVPRGNVHLFASDGDDPAPDLAVRRLKAGPDAWLLDGTPLDRFLARPMEYISTEIEGRRIRPATREALQSWFDEEGSRLGPDDTLLFYVTDHGTPGKTSRANKISLWGKKQTLSVAQLAEMLETIEGGPLVVSLMSQCFSGGFAELEISQGDAGISSGQYCGYFSSTADRQAYGCYPENLGDENVGHSVRFIEGLARFGSFPTSHTHTLVADQTPDVPLRTSDAFLRTMLRRAAAREKIDPIEFVDGLLREAWADAAHHEPEIRLLDRLGQAYGFASPRSLVDARERLAQLPKVAEPLTSYAASWGESLDALAEANLSRFLAAEPEWAARVDVQKVRGMEATAARDLGLELMDDLGPFTRAASGTSARFETLAERADLAGELAYRMAVREAAILRMEWLLHRIAGRVYLESRASMQEREGFRRLEWCEDFRLPAQSSAPEVRVRADYPTYASDLVLAEDVLPAWLGIQFRQAPDSIRKKWTLADGAVTVQRVYPGSPAEGAGLEMGDVVLGPPDQPFTEPGQVREWTMLSEPGSVQRLSVLRGGRVFTRPIHLKPHPGQFPQLPEPPRVGDSAPAVRFASYRGDVAGAMARPPYLLFFWATWCKPCKAAVPELMDFAAERGVPVIAVTDEPASVLDGFFAKALGPFPERVASDEDRSSFLEYGVSGTPSFVLVDERGIVEHYSTGYSAVKGLSMAGWEWSARPR